MSQASLAAFAPVLDPALAAAVRRGVASAVRTAAFATACIMAAGFVWLLLAGPGFVSDRASTATPRHMVH